MNNMAKLFVGAFKRNHNAILVQFRHPANAFGEVFHNHIGLLPIVMGFVHNEHNPFLNIVPEIPTKLLVGFFGNFSGKASDLKSAIVKIHIKMFRLNVIPRKIFILDFIFTEILSRCLKDPGNQGQQGNDDHTPHKNLQLTQ